MDRVVLASFRPNLDPVQTRLALLETIAHLEHLRLDGKITSVTREGIVTYAR